MEEVETGYFLHLVDRAHVVAHGMLLAVVVVYKGYATFLPLVGAYDGLEKAVGHIQAFASELGWGAGVDRTADNAQRLL